MISLPSLCHHRQLDVVPLVPALHMCHLDPQRCLRCIATSLAVVVAWAVQRHHTKPPEAEVVPSPAQRGGHGKSWIVMDSHGWSWMVVDGHGWSQGRSRFWLLGETAFFHLG
eukprot:Skav231546  [mRNA]  locus=scaffold84:782710:783045:+ [translate_table: standard]